MRFKQLVPLFFTAHLLHGCGNSDPIDTTVNPPFVEAIEAFLLESEQFKVIEIPNSDLPEPRRQATTSILVSEIELSSILDTDLKSLRDDDRRPLDRSINPELLVYTKKGSPSQLYLINLASRRSQMVLDLENPTPPRGDKFICNMAPASIFDKETLDIRKPEVKQQQSILLETSTDNCDTSTQRFWSMANLTFDTNSNYTVKQLIEVEKTRQLDSGALETYYEFEERSVSYREYASSRISYSSLENRFNSPSPIIDSENNQFGYLGFKEEPLPELGSNSVQPIFELSTPIDVTNLNTISYWSFNAPISTSDQETRFQIVNTLNQQESGPFLFLKGRELLAVDRENIFDLDRNVQRNTQLTNPIYTWIDQPSETSINLLESNAINLIDDMKIKSLNANFEEKTLRSFDASTKELKLVKSRRNILAKTVGQNDAQSLLILDAIGVTEILVGQTQAIQTFPYQNHFDYHMIDAGGIDNRFAQSHDSGTLKFIPAIENSAWMSLKNFIEDDTQQLILHSDDTSGGIMRSPNIYTFDALENNGQGVLKGTIDGDFAVIEEAAIIGERFGMIWVRESFAEDATLQAYYFNPSDSEWSFNLVSDDTIMPDWLPYIAP